MVRSISSKRLWKGLEPLIAAIVLIAITLVIAIAVTAWLLGVFRAGVEGAERLTILPNATLNVTGLTLNMTIINHATIASKIAAINISNCSVADPSPLLITFDPGEAKTIDVTLKDCKLFAGVVYQVRIVTEAGNTFYTSVVGTS